MRGMMDGWHGDEHLREWRVEDFVPCEERIFFAIENALNELRNKYLHNFVICGFEIEYSAKRDKYVCRINTTLTSDCDIRHVTTMYAADEDYIADISKSFADGEYEIEITDTEGV